MCETMKNKIVSDLLPISGIVPTRNRHVPLARMLHSLAKQSVQPTELIVVDGSDNDQTLQLCVQGFSGLATQIKYYRATEIGAAAQRIQAMAHVTQATIWSMEDDIILEPDCLMCLWTALQNDSQLGGVSAMMTNQNYQPPGSISRLLFHFLHGQAETSYAGKCIGPAFNVLPEDNPDLPEVVLVEWLITGCTLYRRSALPEPLFPKIFTGYSLMEDVALSLTVGKQWKLANVRTARIFHDSQPGDHKNDPGVLAQMDLVNRYYVMTRILGRQQWQDYFKLLILQLFGLVASLFYPKGWQNLPKVLRGKLQAIMKILFHQTYFESFE